MKNLRTLSLTAILLFLISSCTYFEKDPIVIPVPDETEDLEAVFVESPPNSITNPYWTSISDFTRITVTDQVTGMVDGNDGVYNVNNMQNGLTDFNEGNDPELVLKAAYDNDAIYILAEWNDVNFNASNKNWLYNGPEDPSKPGENTDEWTSQRTDDQLIFQFSIDGSSNDVWKWSLSLSEPMGYAIDMIDDGGGPVNDSGNPMFQRNVDGASDRSGPMYEWDAVQQELERDISGFTILDPAFYLINKTNFIGDIENGLVMYTQECEDCHGVNGDGDGNFGFPLPLNGEGGLTRISRSAFDLFAGSNEHTGNSHWTVLTSDEKDDVVAYIRGISGVPGYYLEEPTGSSADIAAGSNVQLARINPNSDNPGYKVLFIRSLNTGNSDDVQFNINEKTEFNFEVFLTDSDNLNRIGSTNEVLIIK